MKPNEILDKILIWAYQNALNVTTYSDGCSDDGEVYFKRTDTLKQGDWSQDEWDDKIKNFQEDFIDYNELIKFIIDIKSKIVEV